MIINAKLPYHALGGSYNPDRKTIMFEDSTLRGYGYNITTESTFNVVNEKTGGERTFSYAFTTLNGKSFTISDTFKESSISSLSRIGLPGKISQDLNGKDIISWVYQTVDENGRLFVEILND